MNNTNKYSKPTNYKTQLHYWTLFHLAHRDTQNIQIDTKFYNNNIVCHAPDAE